VKVDITVSPFDHAAGSRTKRLLARSGGGSRRGGQGAGGGGDGTRRPGAWSASPIERAIEELVYEHLADLVDFERLFQLQQNVELRLFDLVAAGRLPELDREDVVERADDIVARAWSLLLDHPRRYAAAFAWMGDDDCPLCKELERESHEAKGPTTS